MRNSSICDCECNKARKIGEYLDIKNCSCEKYLIGKFVLGWEDEILNKNKTSPDNKNLTCKKNSRLIDTILLVIIYLLLLAVVSICSYYHYKRDSIKSEYVL